MKSPITYDTLWQFAHSNDNYCRSIRAIVLSFTGLGDSSTVLSAPFDSRNYADRDILFLQPYTNPWAWMNRQAVALTDELIDLLMEHYKLPPHIPVILTGKSMGGLGAMLYAIHGKYKPVGIVLNCPVCDISAFCRVFPKNRRTVYNAYWDEDGTLEEIMKAHSPIHLLDQLPRVRYHFFQCSHDLTVSKEEHADRMVTAMQESGFELTYDIDFGRDHVDLSPEMELKFFHFVCDLAAEYSVN